MTWVLIITALVNGQVVHPDKLAFETKEKCVQALKVAEQHPTFKAYNAVAVCEKAP